MNQDMMKDGALTVKRAAEFSSLSRTELYALMGKGTLPFFNHGKRRLIPKSALIKLLADEYTCQMVKSG